MQTELSPAVAQDFIDQLSQVLTIAEKVRKLQAGDYEGLLQLAHQLNYQFPKQALMEAISDDFLTLLSNASNGVWQKDYHVEGKSQLLTAQTTWTVYQGMALLQGQRQQACYDLILEMAKTLQVRILHGALHQHQVTLAIQYPMNMAFGNVVATMKSKTSQQMKAKYPDLAEQLHGMPLWTVDET